MITDKERVQRSQEHNWNLALLTGSPDRDAYQALPSRRLAFVYKDSSLAIWKTDRNRVTVVNRYRVTDVIASARDGFVVTLADEQHQRSILIGHLPTRLPDTDCFIWIPRHVDVRYIPVNSDNPAGMLRLSLSIMLGSGSPLRAPDGVECLTYAKDLPKIAHQLGEVVNA